MKGAKLSVFEAAVPDLQWIGTEWRGTCLSCHHATLRLLVLGPDEIEPTCIHCQPVQILDSVRAALGMTKNGSKPPEPPQTSGAFVASVARFQHEEDREAPDELEPEALYGLPGEALLAILPHTESHPAAILGSLLVSAACSIGRAPHVYRDGARHAVNNFVGLVGVTGEGRKGTATRRTDEIFRALYSDDSNYISQYDISPVCSTAEDRQGKSWSDHLLNGLGSGEALISSLAEAQKEGEPYPRRLVFEEEFARSLKVMSREGSILSETLRAAWDGAPLANRTKGKTVQVKSAHVCILAHITEAELKIRMGSTEMLNGFANRFLWLITRRSKLLPFGGGEAPIARVVQKMHAAVSDAAFAGRMEFDAETRAVWDEGGIYGRLTTRPPGMLGAVTSRAEAHVTRLALLYAVLDREKEIRLPHLLAALAVWSYSERSCAYLFGTSSGDDYADIVDELLQEAHPGFLTRTEIRDRFGRHAQAGRIPKALALLEKAGKAERRQVKTGGRAAECWSAIMLESRDRSDKRDQSALEMARALVGKRR